MYKLYCDYCGQEIKGPKINLELSNVAKIDGGTMFTTQHYHPDCFNYLYSTDYRRIGGRKVESI